MLRYVPRLLCWISHTLAKPKNELICLGNDIQTRNQNKIRHCCSTAGQMTPPKTFLGSVLSPRPRPGRNLFLTLGRQGSSSALPQPFTPAQRAPRSCNGRLNRSAAAAEPLAGGSGRRSLGLTPDQLSGPPASVLGRTAAREADQSSLGTGSVPLWGRGLHGPVWGDGHFATRVADAG